MSNVIQPDNLIAGKALSLSTQPHLASLIEQLQSDGAELAVVAGAGVSAESGLPTWEGLVANIADNCLSAQQVQMISILEQDNIERRASMTFAMARIHDESERRSEHIRNALILRPHRPEPGPLAQAIARLSYTMKTPTKLLTTNYDDLIERAIDRSIGREVSTSYSIQGRKAAGRARRERTFADWESLSGVRLCRAVLHLHGKIPLSDSDDDPELPLTPIVLTETDYLSHGPRVVDAIVSALRGRVAIFFGMSMTDPNLLAALRKCKDDGIEGERYLVTAPVLRHAQFTPLQCAQTAREVAVFLEQAYGLRPILVKTYAQVAQVAVECALAVDQRKRYLLTGDSSLRYGRRVVAAVEYAYDALGVPKSPTADPSEELRRASAVLSARLWDLDNRNSLGSVLARLQAKYAGQVAADERMGVYIWLRNFADFKERSYSLRLVLNSVYSHVQGWSEKSPQPIEAWSEYTAVKAMFHGRLTTGTSVSDPASDIWRGTIAAPIFLQGVAGRKRNGDHIADQVLIGCLSVDSTAYVDDPGDPAEPVPAEMRSVFQVASVSEKIELIGAVEFELALLI